MSDNDWRVHTGTDLCQFRRFSEERKKSVLNYFYGISEDFLYSNFGSISFISMSFASNN